LLRDIDVDRGARERGGDDQCEVPGKAPLAAETTAQVVALTLASRGQAVHRTAAPGTDWTGRAMAKAIGISVGLVQRIWRAHKLPPHRLRTFKRSRDPSFATKLTDIVGLGACPRAGHRPDPGVDPPPTPWCCRPQPGLPIKPGLPDPDA
jgi:hypothetical protein